MSDMRKALEAARAELKRHDEEYQHRTDADVFAAIDAALAQSRPVTAGREEIARIIFPYDSDPNRNYARWETQRADALDKADAILALLNPNAEPANHATAERQPETVGDDRERMEAGSMKAIVTGDPASTHSTLPPQDGGAEMEALRKAVASCQGEQKHFESWAIDAGYDMHQHPLHYLFLDSKTNAARVAWKAALRYAEAALPRAERKAAS
jgi:hypothetical protein